MLESRVFAPSCIVKNSKLVAKARLSSTFPYKSLRNGYHEYFNLFNMSSSEISNFYKSLVKNKIQYENQIACTEYKSTLFVYFSIL